MKLSVSPFLHFTVDNYQIPNTLTGTIFLIFQTNLSLDISRVYFLQLLILMAKNILLKQLNVYLNFYHVDYSW